MLSRRARAPLVLIWLVAEAVQNGIILERNVHSIRVAVIMLDRSSAVDRRSNTRARAAQVSWLLRQIVSWLVFSVNSTESSYLRVYIAGKLNLSATTNVLTPDDIRPFFFYGYHIMCMYRRKVVAAF